MTRAMPQFDQYIARAVDSGLVCSSCGTEFVEPHGHKTACAYCWSRLSIEERADVQKATHEEANVAANRKLGHDRKQARKQ